ncbi:MAG TPA: hypothetical protein VN035_00785 [Microbacterium sp.]|nr:hypothetical protein [Microbacterium sp.]
MRSGDDSNLRTRREILSAYVTVLGRQHELVQVCATAAGDYADLRSAVSEAFEISDLCADAVLALQVRRFTPAEIERIRAELRELDSRLAES